MELITKAGFKKLQEKLESFRGDVEASTERIKNARADSAELTENQEYMEAKDDQNRLDAKIIELTKKISSIRVIDINDYPMDIKGKVRFGCTVTVIDCGTDEEFIYQIVGVDEVDVTNKQLFQISYKSPIGSALLRKGEGDVVDVVLPKGERELEIVKLEYK